MDQNAPAQPSVFEQAVALYQQGRFQEALAVARRGLAESANVAGAAAQRLGLADEAERLWRAAIAAQPAFADAHSNLGGLLKARGRLEEAEAAYRQALTIRPTSAEIHCNLALLLQQRDRLDEAEATYRHALRLNPQLAEAHYNLGRLLHRRDRLDEAAAAYRQALAIRPRFPEALTNSGALWADLGRPEEAEATYRQALALYPEFAEAHYNLGLLLQDQGRAEAALAAYRQTVEHNPGHLKAVAQMLHQCLHVCAWQELPQREQQVRACVRAGADDITPFSFLALHAPLAEQAACARHWTGRQVAVAADAVFRHTPTRQGGKIRLGYLSADFHEHATAYLAAELFERHDRECFEVIAYSYGPADESAMRARLVRAFDRFIDIRQLSHTEAAARIRGDAVDILIDLKGYTRSARPAILA